MPADGSESNPRFFPTPESFRRWLSLHHDKEPHLWVGYYKKHTAKASVTWEETVEEALCFGWIDGVRKSRDSESYMIRFTPRRPGSVWSQRNLDLVPALVSAGRMRPEGLAAFEHRDVHPDSGYRAADEPAELDQGMQARFQAAEEAWAFFLAQPPGYQRQARGWVMSAKREETRQRRFKALLDDSTAGLRLKQFRRT